MSHEITNTDGLVLHAKKAWHGIGKVVESAPTPGQALTLAGIDWQVEERELHLEQQTGLATMAHTPITTHKALQRSDNNQVLSVVGTNYEVLQNEELASFCYDLAGEADVRVESAGSLKGGRRIWFLLKSETLCVGKQCDEVEPYVLCYNSHDGSSSLEFMPTTIRVVCNNTLTWARGKSQNKFRFRHTKNMKSHMRAAVQEIRDCFLSIEEWNKNMDVLASQEMSHDQIGSYFWRAYEAVQGVVPSLEDGGKMAASRQARADETIDQWIRTLHREANDHQLPVTKWLAVNAVTNYIDHNSRVNRSVRSDHADSTEARTWSNLFGGNAAKKARALSVMQSM